LTLPEEVRGLHAAAGSLEDPGGTLRPAERVCKIFALYILLSINSGVLIDYFSEYNRQDAKDAKKTGKKTIFRTVFYVGSELIGWNWEGMGR